MTLYPVENGEPFNVLRYEVGQKYDSHFDTFDPESYGCAPGRTPTTHPHPPTHEGMRWGALPC